MKTELKALRARMLDQQTFGPNIAKSVAEGRTEKPTVSIPPTTMVADGSALPAWVINTMPKRAPQASASKDAMPPYNSWQIDRKEEGAPGGGDELVAASQGENAHTIPSPTTTQDMHLLPNTHSSDGLLKSEPVRRERPPKPYQMTKQPREPVTQMIGGEENAEPESTDKRPLEEEPHQEKGDVTG